MEKINTVVSKAPKEFQRRKIPRLPLIIVAIVSGVFGGYLLISSRAATACTTTLNPGANVASSISSASPGEAICLNNGSYGSLNLNSISKSSDVTIQSVSGTGASLSANVSSSDHIKFQNLTITGMTITGTSKNITVKGSVFTDQLILTLSGSSDTNILIDSSTFSDINVSPDDFEARLHVVGGSGKTGAGVQISNNYFSGGCSDGVRVDADGIEVGPGNEFTNIYQNSCVPHIDSLQIYGGSNANIHDNYFHSVEDCIMAPDGTDHETIANNVCVTGGTQSGFTLGSDKSSVVSHNTFSSTGHGQGVRIYSGNSGQASTGTALTNNVFMYGGTFTVTGGTQDYNLGLSGGAHSIAGTPIFAGGSSPTTFAGYALATSSPGYHASSDGSSIGVNGSGSATLPPPTDTTAPTVSLAAPANNSTVSGSSVAVSASAADDTAVAGVQFKLDGNNLGSEDTASPYSTTWDTTAVANGSHTLTAVARDAAGNTKTANNVSVTVSNSTGSGGAFYIRDGGTSSSCTDWANACDALPATLQRGATYYIASGSYAGRTFNTAASGTQTITIKGATAASHGSNTGWNDSYSVSVSDGGGQATWTSGLSFTTSYWVFDGSVGPAWSKTTNQYGFKFNPVNYAIRVYNTSTAITNVTVSHISAVAPSGDVEKFFLSTDNETKSVNNVTFSNCLLNGWSNAVWATSAGLQMNNWLIENNVILNGYSSAANHGEDINNNYGHLDNLTVRYNWFEGRTGSTGSIVVLNGPAGPYFIYGNVFKNMEGGDGIITGVHYTLTGVIYNNTFDNVDNGYGNGDWVGHDVAATVSNNIVANGVASIGGTFTGTKDYNAYYNTTNTPSEAHGYSSSSNPFVNETGGNLHLTSAAASAMPAGNTLAAPYNMDVEGNIRNADGKWDRGAYAYTGTVTQPPDATAPTVSFISPTNGNTVSGIVTSTVTAADDIGVTKVEISLDDSLKMIDADSPYNYSFDSKTLSNGPHILAAKAYDAAGNTKSTTITVTVNNPDTTPPNAPTNLSGTAPNSTTVNLSWTAATDTGSNPTGVTKYNVLRNGVVIAQPTTTSYSDTGRAANTTYSYVVQAVDGANNVSNNSNTATVTTPPPPTVPDTTAPTVPAGLAATATSTTQVNVSWNASTDTGGSGLAGYNLYRNDTKLNSSLLSSTSYGDSTVSSNTTYSYKVEAVDGAGNKSAQATAASVTTPQAVRGDITGPSGAPDGKIDLRDISFVIRNYNTTNAQADVSGPSNQPDSKVDIFDISYIIRNYGG